MAFKMTIAVEPDGLHCGRCRFLTSAEACALFDSKPWKMRVVHTPGGPTYERLPECIEAEVYARDFMGDVRRFVEKAAKGSK